MPNSNAGYIEIVDDFLKTSYFSKNHDRFPNRVTWSTDAIIYTAISHSRCVVEMSVRPVEDLKEENKQPYKDITDIDYKQLKDNIIKNAVDSIRYY